MNKPEFVYILGWFVSMINIITILNSGFCTCRQFLKALSAEKRLSINFHFSLLITCGAFLAANLLAFYGFYDAWLIKKSFTTVPLILSRFSDRILMCIVSAGLVKISLLASPKEVIKE